jgi:site-specific recombinase
MAFVAPLKFLLGWLKLPLFFAGLVAGVNYAFAFVVLQAFGLTLATKQPSMTAAALAASIDAERDEARRTQLVGLTVRTVRTQLAAIVGNLGVIVPVSVALHFALLALLERPFLDATYATRVLGAHHLFASGSLLFAALTGVWLWASSMVGSWFDNWLRHRRLPDGLRSSRRLRRLLGADRCEQLAGLVDRAAGALVANVTVGLLLGLTPAFAGFFGAPLDIRHITISTASVTLAALTLGSSGIHLDAIAWAVAGLAGIAVMNFTVSFALALGVALRALDVDARVVRTLVRDVIVELRTRPLSFIVPPRD